MRKRSEAAQLTFRFESALATSVVCASQNASLCGHGQCQWAEADVRRAERPLNIVKIALQVARVVDEVFRDYEESAKGAQRIMNARIEGQDAYEHAVVVCTKLRDQLESRTGSMWDGRTEASNESLEGLNIDVHRASNRLKQMRERYNKVALSTTDELRRLRNDMHEDFFKALHGMAVEYARQHAVHAEAWKSLLQCVNEFRRSSKTNATTSCPQGGSVANLSFEVSGKGTTSTLQIAETKWKHSRFCRAETQSLSQTLSVPHSRELPSTA
ncbi:hypothetical protein BWQ96_07250 [Gracilariopsis chorda]|uniref:BAR domain-containing protein n=1 Tax=Gracilariopsis chorda TaxID=448386 RepID=A0A2V3ILN5_9FLOR|nr:hypothetical protein BWQ96_07250 [Gracilariopsis chorda]|eukprot:PXF43002.1 hypothetical protein BWQ96_07250 [Gracilariopsis chorda]